MTPTTQPLPVLAQVANTAVPGNRQTLRLLQLWVDLAQRAASAAAHCDGDEAALRSLQLQVEEALVDRLPNHESVLNELLVWEAELIHVAEMPPDNCLICRKARLGLPADLPLPALLGGHR